MSSKEYHLPTQRLPANGQAAGQAQRPLTILAAPPHRPCSDQLARCKDRLRVDIGHLSHPVYGAPELATALVENPAEYLPIVRLGGLSSLPCSICTLAAHPVLAVMLLTAQARDACRGPRPALD